MTSSMTRNRRFETALEKGFTLVELLIVIGIIAVLISILIPTVAAVKKNGYATDSAAQIKALQAAIMEYHNTFKAYPGPLSEDQLGPTKVSTSPPIPSGISGNVTGTENLVLGLLGGLEPTGSAGNPARYNKTRLGNGPMVLGMDNKTYTAFYDDWSKQIWQDPSDPDAKIGKYCGATTRDSNIPEFVDRFPGEELPILYLRAKPGRGGIISLNGTISVSGQQVVTQYTMQSYIGYLPTTSEPKLHGYPQNSGRGQTTGSGEGGWLGQQNMSLQDKMNGEFTTTALGYFRHPTLTPSNFVGNPMALGTPVAKDEYILISAGKDRTYGTQDDIVSFSR